jgi:RNA polymerase sigma-70 factor (ECF subfamily)
MSRLADGDKSALGELVTRHQGRVLELAYRLAGDRALAEDIGQETFLRIWRAAKTYQPTARFSTWMYRIVTNLCLDAFKKRSPSAGVPAETTGASPAPISVLEADDRSTAVRRAVHGLPERQRVAVVLHRFSELTIREIAASTGWSESAVESLLVRAYAALRESLRDYSKTEDGTKATDGSLV